MGEQRGSAAMLHAKLKIPYAQATRLIHELEQQGVVGPAEDAANRWSRDVLVTAEQLRARRQQAIPGRGETVQ